MGTRYNPAYNHLVSLQQECREKEAPDYVIEGINRALKLIETRDEYCESASSAPSDPLVDVATETRKHPWTQLYGEGKTLFNQHPGMLTGALEGKFLQMLVSMQKVKKVLEIGMYTGYSALSFAEVLPDDGEVVTCDIDPYLKEFAERSFARSPHGQKIKIRLGDAKETLHQLVKEKQSFDMVFIDADKPSYKEYYKMIMDHGLLNKGGTILFDNALFYGQVYAEDRSKEKTPNGCGVRECEDYIKTDSRVQRALVPVRDGLLIVRRKEDMMQ